MEMGIICHTMNMEYTVLNFIDTTKYLIGLLHHKRPNVSDILREVLCPKSKEFIIMSTLQYIIRQVTTANQN